MSSLRTKVIILRRTNYGEADRILLLLTPTGLKSAIAKGVRKEKSRLAGGVELFSLSDVTLMSSDRNNNDFYRLTSARLQKPLSVEILANYEKLDFAYQFLKLVQKAAAQIDDSAWFDLALEILNGLMNKRLDIRLVQVRFYLVYAKLNGYEMNVWRDLSGEPLKEDAFYLYDVNEKSLVVFKNGDLSAEHVKLLRLASSNNLDTLSNVSGLTDALDVSLATARRHAGA